MNSIKFECPHCHATNTGEASSHGQRVQCRNCQATMLVPPPPSRTEPPTARMIPDLAPHAPSAPHVADEETEIFKLSPVARAFPGPILLSVIFVGVGISLALRAYEFPWPRWVALVPLALGGLLLLVVWIRVKSAVYRLTTQRLFVRRGWLAKHVNELELYRVKDVVVDQGVLQRVLGYGTITVLADDDTTPAIHLDRISRPTAVKEMIRTNYRAARQREGVRPTEFLQTP